MKRLLLSALVGLALAPLVAPATDQVWINNGIINGVTPDLTVTVPPQIDAVTVINNGMIGEPVNLLATPPTYPIITPLPFETANTLNFTNTGSMYCAVGWRFDQSPAGAGYRASAVNFFNGNNGLIEAVDLGATITVGELNSGVVTPSYLFIDAANVVNRGQLRVGANGLMELTGKNFDLADSEVGVTLVPDEASGSSYAVFTNYFVPDVAIYDQYWGTTNFDDNYTLNTRLIWGSNRVARAPAIPSPPAAPGIIPGFSFFPSRADSYTNLLATMDLVLTNILGSNYTVNLITNLNKGAAFVAVPPNFSAQIGFTPGLSNFDTIGVLMSLPNTNAATGLTGYSYIYFEDTLASGSGRGLLLNVLTLSTYRPTNYLVDRLNTYPGRSGNNGFPEPNFFVDSCNLRTNPPTSINVVSDVVTNPIVNNGDFSGYSPFVDNVVSRPPAVVGGTITNLPGSIKIKADNLDLSGTRLSANGQVTIQASRLISTADLMIDCENLNFDIGATNRNLKVENLVSGNIGGRIQGPIRAWSAVWSNTVRIYITNNYAFTNFTDTNGVLHSVLNSNAPVEIFIGVGYHTLLLDARSLISSFPVYIYDFFGHGNDINIKDNMRVLQSLLIDGKSFTLDGTLTIPGEFPLSNPINLTVFPGIPLKNWIGTNAPRLQNFTNNGSLAIANEAHFGDDRLVPFSTFINNGSINAASLNINATYFEASGGMAALGGIVVQCNDGKLENGSSSAGNFAQFFGNTVKFFSYQLTVGGALDFTVTNALFDAGPGSGNLFQVQNGFNLRVKPPTGDLLGTAILSSDLSTAGRRIIHTWAGENRGATPAGFINNEAVGTLSLSSRSLDAKFVFGGTGPQNGLYVDLLDLSALGTNFEQQIQINPNLVIYYAAATLSFTPPQTTNGVDVLPEEYLNGKFGGHLQWVQTFAGPNSTADVIVTNANGQEFSIPVNFALRWSRIIDSDGDGTANGLQPYPFKAATVSVKTKGRGTVAPNYDGQLLLVGQTYKMVAQPGDAFVFKGWSGDLVYSLPDLTFVVPSNGLSLVASFSFVAPPGSYSGLFYEREPIGIELQRSGAFTITTTKSGQYSGSLQIGTKRFSFSGNLNDSGGDTATVKGGSLSVELQIGSNTISGAVSNGTNWTAFLQGDRTVFNSRTNKAPFAGKYTIIFPGTEDPGDTINPQGDGYGTVAVDASGRARLSGVLADGTKVARVATVTADRHWPLYVPFSRDQGQILGWLNFDSTAVEDIGGQFDWIRKANAKAKFYPDGFHFQTNAVGSTYNPAIAPVTGFDSGMLILTGGNLSEGITNSLAVSSDNKVTFSDDQSRITLKKSQGLFSGSVINPATGKPIKFNGAILQKLKFGSGYFLGTNQSGTVFFGSP